MGKTEIGENAGKVWNVLNEVNEISLENLAARLHLRERDLALSIGWLTRENKVLFSEKGGQTYVSNGEMLNFVFG